MWFVFMMLLEAETDDGHYISDTCLKCLANHDALGKDLGNPGSTLPHSGGWFAEQQQKMIY